MTVPVYLGQTGGWLAPSGDFYACRDNQHEQEADRLAEAIYGRLGGSIYLDERRWIRVKESGLLLSGFTSTRRITPGQRLMLHALIDLAPSTPYGRQMAECLELIDEDV